MIDYMSVENLCISIRNQNHWIWLCRDTYLNHLNQWPPDLLYNNKKSKHSESRVLEQHHHSHVISLITQSHYCYPSDRSVWQVCLKYLLRYWHQINFNSSAQCTCIDLLDRWYLFSQFFCRISPSKWIGFHICILWSCIFSDSCVNKLHLDTKSFVASCPCVNKATVRVCLGGGPLQTPSETNF